MSEDDLLDMDYFLNEDVEFDDDSEKKVFIFLTTSSLCHPQTHVYLTYVR